MSNTVLAHMKSCCTQSLSALAPAMATVIRGGSTLQINAADVVRGDVVILNTGDKVTHHITILTATIVYGIYK
jgi:magnesium-transporting ATPase (P-type)